LSLVLFIVNFRQTVYLDTKNGGIVVFSDRL